MPAHTPQPGAGLTWTDRMAALGGQSAFGLSYVARAPQAPSVRSAGASHRRSRGTRAWSVTVPLTRCAVVALSAGLVLSGGPATVAGDRYTGSGGAIPRPPAERALEAQSARLTALAHGHAHATRVEALAVAGAALDAAAAVRPLTATLAPEAAAAQLEPAVEQLTRLVQVARTPDEVPAEASVQPAPGRVLVAATAVTDTAAEVFRLSMEVETLTRAAAEAASVDRSAGLVALEQAVDAAEVTATELAELEPLVPLPEPLELGEALGSASEDRPARRARATTSGARLSVDAPAGVVELVERWDNGAIPAGDLCAVDFSSGALLQCDAAEALSALNAAYRAEFGADLQVTSSYRTYEAQVGLRASKGFLAAPPGTSNHGWGLAVDLGGIGGLGQFDSPKYAWLQEHAEDYGWHHPRAMEPGGSGPQEPWHWEFGTA